MIFLLVIVGLLINMLIGLYVVVAVDDEKDTLRFWVRSDVLPGGRVVALQFWPLVLWFWFRRSK